MPLAPVTVGGVMQGANIFIHVAPGHCMTSGTTKRNTNARDNQDEMRVNYLIPKISSQREIINFICNCCENFMLPKHVSNKASRHLNRIFKLLVYTDFTL